MLPDFFWNDVYFKYTSEFKKKQFILEIYFKYTSEFANKFINLESILQVYFRVSKWIYQYWKSASSILQSSNADRWV